MGGAAAVVHALLLLLGPISSFGQQLYAQPSSMNVSAQVFANPHPWPRSTLSGATSAVCWQHGDVRTRLVTPYKGDISGWTGMKAAAEKQVVIHSTRGGTPWAAVQYTNEGDFGSALNTTGVDPVREHLTTNTLESNWEKCAGVFSAGGQGFRVELDLAVPFAFHGSRSEFVPAAVYVSLSIYLRTMTSPSGFIWYSTPLFDLDRDVVQDHVFIDTVSQKLIVSGPLSGSSAYNQIYHGSTVSQNKTFSKTLHFGYEVKAAHVEQGIRDGLLRFPSHFSNHTLPPNASAYCIPGFNIELEATPNAGAGVVVRNLKILTI
jgi:hypothetical protein